MHGNISSYCTENPDSRSINIIYTVTGEAAELSQTERVTLTYRKKRLLPVIRYPNHKFYIDAHHLVKPYSMQNRLGEPMILF